MSQETGPVIPATDEDILRSCENTSTGTICFVDLDGVEHPCRMTRIAVSDEDYQCTGSEEVVSLAAITDTRTVRFPKLSTVPLGWKIVIKDESGNVDSPQRVWQIRPHADDSAATVDGYAGVDFVSGYTFAGYYAGDGDWHRWS